MQTNGRRRGKCTECVERAHCTSASNTTWGQYSPYYPVPSEIDPKLPPGCHATFAQVLSRHGARSPTKDKAKTYDDLIKSIQSSVSDYAPGFEFLRDYQPNFVPDELSAFGEAEMVDEGKAFFGTYSNLAKDVEPFVRAAGSGRVVMSAQNFTQGFYGAKGAAVNEQILVIPETDGFNNTLEHGGCAAFEDGSGKKLGKKKQQAWRGIFATPIAKRLNTKLPGANISVEQVTLLMDLCAFNTVLDDQARESQFCWMFSKDEWRSYDYYQSLEKWYVYGPGRDFGPTQGVGWVNELLARLTDKPVDDHTTTNSTLDSDEATFPLGRKLYADFTHDNTMMTIYGAMGLFNRTENLPSDRKLSPKQTLGYSASWVVPFAGRMVVEKMVCQGQADEELVRVLINDRVVPLQGCNADKLGRCKLDAFVESQSFSRSGGRWGECAATN